MPRKSDIDFKSFIDQIGALIDARAKTTEYNINLRTEVIVKAAEERIKKELRAEMATKDDIKNMATKDDIKNMATKDDIKNMATKDDIARLEQKIDETNSLRKPVEELRKRLDKLETEITIMKGKN